MLARPVFQYLAMAAITAGIMLAAFVLSPVALGAGVALVAGGIVLLVKHYQQMGTDPDLFVS